MTIHTIDVPGYWVDVRGKRGIFSENLNTNTCDDFNYYDEILTPGTPPLSLQPPFDYASATGSRPWLLGLHSWRFADYWILNSLAQRSPKELSALDAVASDYIANVWNAPNRTGISPFVETDTAVAARAAALAFLLCADGWLE